MNQAPPKHDDTEHYHQFTSAEMGAIAHLYRGEIYRSTIWRTRLDTTTNWSVVTLGVALSIVFSSPSASPLPLLLVGILVFVFLLLEARRYRYFNVWRARCRWLENNFYVPMLEKEKIANVNWQRALADDYLYPHYHVSFARAAGRRLRRSYLWIMAIQGAAYAGKLFVHPVPLTRWDEFFRRAAIGPIQGEWVIAIGVIYLGTGGAIAWWSLLADGRKWGQSGRQRGMG